MSVTLIERDAEQLLGCRQRATSGKKGWRYGSMDRLGREVGE